MTGEREGLLGSSVSNASLTTKDSGQPLLPEDEQHVNTPTLTVQSNGGARDIEWNASMATWEATCKMPVTKDAQPYYRYMLPCAIFINIMSIGGAIVALIFVVSRILKAVDHTIFWLIVPFIALSYLISPALYIYHFFRLRGSEKLPDTLPPGPVRRRPLTHAVVVVSFNEPLEVLKRTFASIAAQEGLGKKPIAVFASEERDGTRHSQAAMLREAYADSLSRFIVTEHVLLEGEVAGKSSNENHALRELRRILDAAGVDPFEVMITIVDADSVLSSTYLANVEDTFYKMPDGRRMIYSGPLNTYRNFAEGNMIIQMHEIQRCHSDLFNNPFGRCFPLSTYSLTLGMCSELDYWTPDNIPEDVHTSIKAILLSYSSHSVVPIGSIICNDLVSGLKDRYEQAKRHHWGITETAYMMAVFKKMPLTFEVFLSYLGAELGRAGSFFATSALLSGLVLKVVVVAFFFYIWPEITPEAKIIIFSLLGHVPWSWFMFWVAEISFWRSPLMRQFEIEHASCCRWILLVILSPILTTIADFLFFTLPVLHILLHVACVGDLEYVTAPKGKGDAEISRTESRVLSGKKIGTKAKERNDSL
mmetsp:Transcript_3681/g.8057  ORF Transcript_3681/g.8057 Transcript_3681/m.8057 type:complete len:591 (+) Transcript_3681:65-1837(+)